MKNIIVVTGGAGFVGSNLILLLLKRTKLKIISIDNYSTGKIKNHSKFEVISIAPLMAEAINRISNSTSVSDLFN